MIQLASRAVEAGSGAAFAREACHTHAVQLLDFRAVISASEPILCELGALFPTSAGPSGPARSRDTSIVVRHDPSGGLFVISQDGEVRCSVPEHGVVAQLEWLIVSTAVERLRSRYLLLHAGAVALRGEGVILSAPSGSGKSTLTAGLVASGFDYLSDEIAAIDPASLDMLPFPRSLCVKEGSRQALAALYPHLATEEPRRRFGDEPVWFLEPPAGSQVAAAAARYLVFPAYAPGAPASLVAVRRSEALQHALSQSFTGSALGERSVGALVALVQRVQCFRLEFGTLSGAVEALRQLAESGERYQD